jgi:lipoprotein-anchoring transpeptidase ErfK/SrfK
MGGMSKRVRWRVALAGLVVVLGLAPIVIGGLAISSAGVVTAAVSHPYTPAPAPKAPPTKSKPSLPGGSGSLVALLRHSTTMRSSPGGPSIGRLGTTTVFGSPTVMWVVQHTSKWFGVVSPLAGNGHLGWIPSSSVSLTRVTWELRVTLSARHVQVLDNGKIVQTYTIAVGAPDAPTPTGRFAVTDRLNTGDPTGPYGCCILALSAEAPHAIQGWSGGNRIAIHSTPETSSIGQDVSHGCMRLTLPEGQWLLNHIPLGTPTLIRA